MLLCKMLQLAGCLTLHSTHSVLQNMSVKCTVIVLFYIVLHQFWFLIKQNFMS